MTNSAGSFAQNYYSILRFHGKKTMVETLTNFLLRCGTIDWWCIRTSFYFYFSKNNSKWVSIEFELILGNRLPARYFGSLEQGDFHRCPLAS